MCPLEGSQINSRDTASTYEKSARLGELVKNAHADTTLFSQWIAGSNCFWYRVKDGHGLFSFYIVAADKRSRRPAFDSNLLAQSLNDWGFETKAESLPITWIDPNIDGDVIKFRIKDKKWQFRDNRILSEYDGDLDEQILRPLSKEEPSESSSEVTFLTFVNKTNMPISLWWIDWKGISKYYETVVPGKSKRMETFVGHVWRVTKSEINTSVASFKSQCHESTAIVEEGMDSMTEEIGNDSEERSLRPCSAETHAQSPESQHSKASEAFVKDFNVWLRRPGDGETQLSMNGTKENPFDSDIYQSPDGRFVVVWQYVPEQEHTVHEVESSPKDQVQPRLKRFQYLKPGDQVRRDRPRMFDLASEKEVTTDDLLFPNPYGVTDMGWTKDGGQYRFLYNQRGHQVLRIVGMDTQGQTRSIVEETSSTFIDYSQKETFYDLCDSSELIWASERDGWNHLYLFDSRTGKMKNQITTGKWVVRSVDRVDAEMRQVWCRAYGVVEDQDPYYAQLIRVNFDGSGFTILTEGDGTHSWSWSPDRRFLIDTWSRVDLAPRTVLREADTGREIMMLEEGNLDALLSTGWTPAERFSAPGRDDDTMIYGIIVKPTDFDASKQYPVIESIYAGPQDFFVQKAFSALVKLHELAELGFVVVQIDGMGTNWRSRAFHDRCYKNLKDAGLPDRIAWMQRAALESRPWMDLSRVGIYGTSAGGNSALAALLWHGDVYKAAVADSGCHDNRMDKLWWNEQWMGWPVDESYEQCSNVVHAGKLKGALMLVVGELDTNVDPASTLQVVNALNEARKDYDLLFVPGGEHGVGWYSEYCVQRRQDFFVRHLLGLEPPKRNGC